MRAVTFDAVDDYTDESDTEALARADSDVVLDELSQAHIDDVVDKLLVIVDEISGHPLRPYQTPFARRVLESLIIGDGETITALFSRQSGKSETVANVVAAAMIMLPKLAVLWPELL